MKKGWTRVALGEVLTPQCRSFIPVMDELYKEVTVALWGKGTRLRKTVLGADISSGGRHQAREGDFILSKIDARHGAYGFISAELDGAAVTNDFPLYRIKSEELAQRWLYWISQSSFFVGLCRSASKGTTNRVRLKESLFEALEIPLPPLSEQERIVAHLDAIESRLARVAELREKIQLESAALLRSLFHSDHCLGIVPTPMRELVKWRQTDTEVKASESYTFAGVYSFGRGVFRKEAKAGMDFSYKMLTRLNAEDFTYPKLMAWEGALGVVPDDCNGCYVSPEFPVFEIDQSRVLPTILDLHFKSPSVWRDLAAISTGTNLRRRRLNPNAFLRSLVSNC